jgi:hypothetical protein
MSNTTPTNDRLRIRFPLLNPYLDLGYLPFQNVADINPNRKIINE